MKVLLTIEDLDIFFEESPVRVLVLRNFPAMKIAGETLGPLEEGKEAQIKYWIAYLLAKAGIVQFRDKIDTTVLRDLHWKEAIQAGKQLAPLPKDLFPKLRRYLSELKDKNPEEYEEVLGLATDIINSRLKKIIGIAAGPLPTTQLLKNLSEEEKILYDTLRSIIEEFKLKIVRVKSDEYGS